MTTDIPNDEPDDNRRAALDWLKRRSPIAADIRKATSEDLLQRLQGTSGELALVARDGDVLTLETPCGVRWKYRLE